MSRHRNREGVTPVAPSLRKRCTLCGREKSALAFGRATRRRDGLQTGCRECMRLNAVARRSQYDQVTQTHFAENVQRSPEEADADFARLHPFGRACARCVTVGGAEMFYRAPMLSDGRAAYCRACDIDRQKNRA